MEAVINLKTLLTIRLSHPSGAFEDDPIHSAALLFQKQKLQEKSDGKIKAKIFPSGQLGGEERNVQDIQNIILHSYGNRRHLKVDYPSK
ncbi:MAG: hypothetical protein ACRCY4_10550 [Brevinema sp.]